MLDLSSNSRLSFCEPISDPWKESERTQSRLSPTDKPPDVYLAFRSEVFVIWLTFPSFVLEIEFWLFSFELVQFNYSSSFEPTRLLENNIIHMISRGQINEDRKNNEFILMEFSKFFSFRKGRLA